MRRATWLHGRRGALVGASTAVVCLGAVLAACGDGGSGGGYVAVGAPADSGPVVAPTGNVSLTPLPESTPLAEAAKGAPQQGRSAPQPPPSASPGTATDPGDDNSPRTGAGSGATSAPSARPTPGSTAGTSPPGTPSPPGPAVLDVSEPTREGTDKRWCEKVTVSFRNTGGSAVRSGTVTLGTHIIGALGIDWATIDSTRDLPVPIAAGAGSTKTWTVCVDDWRVPLGMHIETRDVSVQWK
ncbi:hypothetical protein ACFY1B_36955 [Streptomyces mirabilis]|uniref:hypothetical protein n=1 Tax=Streptomyces TaxID=1883 RepID=UPI0029A21D6C|nr:hypothetical protein [Streptomyces sp. AK02-04a]